MKKSKADLEKEFGVPVFVKWNLVSTRYDTRYGLKKKGIIVPENAKPDAIKGGGMSDYYLLFLVERFKKNEQ